MAVLAALGCAPLIDETGRGCPCADGYVCCASTNMCIVQGGVCAEAEAGADARAEAEAGAEAEADAGGDAGADAEADADAAPRCGVLPAPVVRFAFDDCDTRGRYADTAGGLVGERRGAGVRCVTGPLGPALAFNGPADGAPGGSYVRVDRPDAAPRACTDACVGKPLRFGAALTISVVLNVDGFQQFAHILGQWFERDAFMLLTEGDDAGQQMELAIQPEGDAASINLGAPVMPGKWTHWVAVFGDGAARLYRDGALVAHADVPAGARIQCTDVPLELGQIGREGPCGDIDYAYFNGAIGDLRLYDVALTESQIANLECAIR